MPSKSSGKTILKIKVNKKDVVISFVDRSKERLSLEVLANFYLYEGKTISNKELKEMKQLSNQASLLKYKDVKGVLLAILEYSKNNFSFIRSCYNSAAHDLVDAFFYNKIISKVFTLLNNANNYSLSVASYRNISRRYASIVGNEFGYCFRDATITINKFDRYMRRYITASLVTVLPSLVELSREEKKR